jgi:arabinan endo-1,5-alpha-L-arabinosidase
MTAKAVFCLLILLLPLVATGQSSPSGRAMEPRGDVRQVHDPTIIKDGDTFYLFSTRAGIAVRCSKDLVGWRLCGDVFAHIPAWAVNDVQGLRGIWAPDISYFNGRYHLYYSASTFGSNRSSIGLAINQTLDPTSDKYRWQDQGKIISSSKTDDWNAIDPNIVIDEHGEPWMSFGSFWSGIKMRKIDAATGKLASTDTKLYSLATRPRSTELPGAIEAPAIWRRGDYYYLFVSFDFCCRGVDSTYNIRVGRSKRVTGPYLDRDGKDMLDGGGTLVLGGGKRWRGPGHCAILRDQTGDKLVYHAYDAEARGVSTLKITPINWKADWPTVSVVDQ